MYGKWGANERAGCFYMVQRYGTVFIQINEKLSIFIEIRLSREMSMQALFHDG